LGQWLIGFNQLVLIEIIRRRKSREIKEYLKFSRKEQQERERNQLINQLTYVRCSKLSYREENAKKMSIEPMNMLSITSDLNSNPN
jgi:hypothetical protein